MVKVPGSNFSFSLLQAPSGCELSNEVDHAGQLYFGALPYTKLCRDMFWNKTVEDYVRQQAPNTKYVDIFHAKT